MRSRKINYDDKEKRQNKIQKILTKTQKKYIEWKKCHVRLERKRGFKKKSKKLCP